MFPETVEKTTNIKNAAKMWVLHGVVNDKEYIPLDGPKIYEWRTRKDLEGRGRVTCEDIISEIVCKGWKTQRQTLVTSIL